MGISREESEYPQLYQSLTNQERRLLYIFLGDNFDSPFTLSSLEFFAADTDLIPHLSSLLESEVLKKVTFSALDGEVMVEKEGYQMADATFYIWAHNWIKTDISLSSNW